jgi:hypothetical protein
MTPTIITVKKAFAYSGGMATVGNWMELYIGSNITQERFNDLLEIGAITLGKDEEFLKQQAEENSAKNRGE